MKRSYLETLFRHKLLVLTPVVLAFVLGTAFGLSQPRTYLASAGVWADSSIPTDSTIGTTGGQTPPSAGQAALLGELLASRSFLLDVARASPLAGSVSDSGSYATDDLLARLAGSVTMNAAGPQVLTVTVVQDTPELAVGVAKAVAAQLLAHENASLTQRARVQIDYDQNQLTSARSARDLAQTALQSYLTSHPTTAGQDDQSAPLLAAASLAQQQFSDAQKNFTKDDAGLAHIGDGSVLRVLDQPTRAYGQSRRKTVAFAAVGGLLAGATIAAGLLMLLIVRDRSVHSPEEVEQELGLEVVSSIVQLPARRPSRTPLGGPASDVSAAPGTS